MWQCELSTLPTLLKGQIVTWFELYEEEVCSVPGQAQSCLKPDKATLEDSVYNVIMEQQNPEPIRMIAKRNVTKTANTMTCEATNSLKLGVCKIQIEKTHFKRKFVISFFSTAWQVFTKIYLT